MAMTDRMPVLFLGHGSPMTMITDNPERRALEALGRALPRPGAILCVTAHWETYGRTHLTAAPAPPTIHDFGGFPAELYEMRYPAPGSPGLVERIAGLLGEDRVARDAGYGFDHGAWGVLLPMLPAADIPLVAMSLDRSLSPEQHLQIGAQLAPLRDEGVLLVASGNIVHNLALWRQSVGTVPGWAAGFQRRVNEAVVAGEHDVLTHEASSEEPEAALAVNSGEHYLPLLYAMGARHPSEPATIFSDRIEGALSMTSILIGDPALLDGIG